MTHPQSEMALRALADFWTDMGLEEARALRTWRPPGAAAAPRAPAPARAPTIARTPDMPAAPRGAPRKLNNNPINDAKRLPWKTVSGKARIIVGGRPKVRPVCIRLSFSTKFPCGVRCTSSSPFRYCFSNILFYPMYEAYTLAT
jgi:hypothetical protein